MPAYKVTLHQHCQKPRQFQVDDVEDLDDLRGYCVAELGLDWELDVLDWEEIEPND